MKKQFKILRYFVIELAFTAFIIWHLSHVKNLLSPVNTPYETDLFAVIVFGAIILIWFIGPMLNRFALLVYNGFFTLYLISQNIYIKAFHQYYRFNTAVDLLKEVWGERSSAYEFITLQDLWPLIILAIGCICFFVLYLVLQRKCFKLIFRFPYKLAILLLLLPIGSRMKGYEARLEEARHTIDTFQYNKTDAYIYEVIPNNNQFVEKFGLLPFAYRDAQTFLIGEVLSDNDYLEIENYLSKLPEHLPNEMTGIFKGKSIIVIQAESFNNIALDPDLTPTIYKMATEGINIHNFNTPSLPGSTSDTEIMTNTSIIPRSEGHASCYSYPYNSFLTTLPKLFNEAGYRTNVVHNNYGEYYNRDVVFPNLGYQHYSFSYDLGFDDRVSDLQIMDVLEWIYVERDYPYMEYWITYSGHQPYEYDSVGVEEEYLEQIKAKYPNMEESYASYLAKNMDLDKALANLFALLEEYGKLDDVVFVFFGDHLVKGIDLSEGSSFYKQMDTEYSRAASYTDLYIYNSSGPTIEYDKIGTALDLLPTIANLWGFEYDSHTVLGRDLFDKTYDGVFFGEWDYWRTPHYYYDPVPQEFLEMENGYSLEKAEQEMTEMQRKIDISSKILKLDYFKAFVELEED